MSSVAAGRRSVKFVITGLADMVILNSDPLADIRNVRSIWRVIRNGVAHDPEELLGGLE